MSAEDEQVACDTALALLLGISQDRAAAAARHVESVFGRLGLLTTAAVAAARWGIDLVPAVERLAEAEPLRGAISDYEQRYGAEEATDELERALERLHPPSASSPQAAVPLPSDQLEVAAVLAARAGSPRWSVDSSSGVPPSHRAIARVAALAAHIGAEFTAGDEAPSAGVELDPDGHLPAYVGFGVLHTP